MNLIELNHFNHSNFKIINQIEILILFFFVLYYVALHSAAEGNSKRVVELLLNKGADIEEETFNSS